MDDRKWCFPVPTSSSKYDQSYFDDLIDYEEIDEDNDIEADYPCPFCSEDFDIVGLCCHIEEEHYDEAKSGVCPLCGTRVGADLVEHIALRHENIHKALCGLSLYYLSDWAAYKGYPTPSEAESKPLCSSAEASVEEEVKALNDDDMLVRGMNNCVISDEKQEEHTQRCKFMQSLVFSTFLDYGL